MRTWTLTLRTLQYFLKKFNISFCPTFLLVHENMKKLTSKRCSQLTHFFSVLPTGLNSSQNQPKSHILFHKNGYLRDFYTMTLMLTETRKLPRSEGSSLIFVLFCCSLCIPVLTMQLRS